MVKVGGASFALPTESFFAIREWRGWCPLVIRQHSERVKPDGMALYYSGAQRSVSPEPQNEAKITRFQSREGKDIEEVLSFKIQSWRCVFGSAKCKRKMGSFM
jgi:hypothetical protein